MVLRKRAPGTGLQVLLEASGSWLLGELDHDKRRPGSMLHRPPPLAWIMGELRRDRLRLSMCSLLSTSGSKRPTQTRLARSASEVWLGVRDDFRPWLMSAA